MNPLVVLLAGLGTGLLIGSLAFSGVGRWRPRRRREGPYRKLVETALAELVSGDDQGALRALRQANQLQSDDDALYLLLAELLRRDGDRSRAERAVDVLLAKRELAGPLRAAAWQLKGRLFADAGRDESAAEALEKAASSAEESSTALETLGTLLERRGRYEAALAATESLAKRDPGRAAPLLTRRRVLLAEELLERDEAPEARAHAKHALADAPGAFAAQLVLGDALLKLERPSDACEAWRAAAATEPTLAVLVLTRLEGVSELVDDPELARRFARQHAESDAASWHVLAWLVDEALRRDALEEARTWHERLRELDAAPLTSARLDARLAAAEDGMRVGSHMMSLLAQTEREPLWADPARCVHCGHASLELGWRCPACGEASHLSG